jgi:hypothetical protein
MSTKMTHQHTPGPWNYDGPNAQTAHIIHVADGEIAEAFSEWISNKQAEANANLIAAAPDMLEALEYIEAMVNDGIGDQINLDKLEHVIAKARGQS